VAVLTHVLQRAYYFVHYSRCVSDMKTNTPRPKITDNPTNKLV